MMIKKFIYASFLAVFLCSCEAGTDVTPPEEELNMAPSVPELVHPANNQLCIDNELNFQWTASTDSNGNPISYEIEVSKDNQFSEIAFTASIDVTSQAFTLEKNTAYYWRVRASDNQNLSSAYSGTFNLYTEGTAETNHLPFAPEIIAPTLQSSENAGVTTLEWTGSDTDGDPLVYDVYFGTENPPTTLASENQSQTTFDVTTVAVTDYFWKVVVKDDNGGQTVGQVWNFITN